MADILSGLINFYKELVFHQDPTVNTIINLLLILFTGALAWCAFNIVSRRIEKRYEKNPFFSRNLQLFDLFRKAGHYIVLILVCAGLINLVHLDIIGRIFYGFMIILIGSFLNSALTGLMPYFEQNLATKTTTKVDDALFDIIKRFSSIIIYTTAIILTLDVLGVNIMPFVAGAGVAGIAIGFAAKDTLSNLIAGILLIMDRPFEIGDRIEIWSAPANSATWGDVIDIGLRATKIQTTDNIVIVIPNNEIMMRDIINYTTITKEIRVRVPIGIAYDADVQKAKNIICKVALELNWVMRDPAPKVIVRSFGDSAVNLQARVWIDDPRKRMDTISHITDRVKEVFNEEGIEIPFPKRDIYIKREK